MTAPTDEACESSMIEHVYASGRKGSTFGEWRKMVSKSAASQWDAGQWSLARKLWRRCQAWGHFVANGERRDRSAVYVLSADNRERMRATEAALIRAAK